MRMRRVQWAVDYLPLAKCREFEPETKKGIWQPDRTRKLHVEIGTGKGQYALEMARLYPETDWIAIEKNDTAAGMAAHKFDEAGQENLRFIYGDARLIADWFAPGEVDVIHLNFSDPWPKNRNAKRRLSADSFLQQYRQILAADGRIEMKTDNSGLFEYSVLQFLKDGWHLVEFSVDFRRDAHPEDVPTEYESRFIEKGQPVYRAVWKKQ